MFFDLFYYFLLRPPLSLTSLSPPFLPSILSSLACSCSTSHGSVGDEDFFANVFSEKAAEGYLRREAMLQKKKKKVQQKKGLPTPVPTPHWKWRKHKHQAENSPSATKLAAEIKAAGVAAAAAIKKDKAQITDDHTQIKRDDKQIKADDVQIKTLEQNQKGLLETSTSGSN